MYKMIQSVFVKVSTNLLNWIIRIFTKRMAMQTFLYQTTEYFFTKLLEVSPSNYRDFHSKL